MKYFSVDYRSPPSGLGQIVTPGSDDIILISYPGCGISNDPSYSHTIYLDHPKVRESEWIGPMVPFLHQLLKSFGIEKVYDSEEGYNHPEKCDNKHHFNLDTWINILKSYG
jgi:hypothetical protein